MEQVTALTCLRVALKPSQDPCGDWQCPELSQFPPLQRTYLTSLRQDLFRHPEQCSAVPETIRPDGQGFTYPESAADHKIDSELQLWRKPCLKGLDLFTRWHSEANSVRLSGQPNPLSGVFDYALSFDSFVKDTGDDDSRALSRVGTKLRF
jgi:hypothetical protein